MILKEMKELVDKLNYYAEQYYVYSNSVVSDATYDMLLDTLKQMEKDNNYMFSNSPTIRVGGQILKEFEEVKHEHPLLSLEKTQDINVLYDFINQKEGILMLKLDGLTIDNLYRNGELTTSATRGNGDIGENVTNNAKTFCNLPIKLPLNKTVHVIGEAIIDKNTFNKINNSIIKAEDKYKNCRNLASGSVKQLDNSICKQRGVSFIAYNLKMDKNFTSTKINDLDFLKAYGFSTVPYRTVQEKISKENLQILINELKEESEQLGYPIDGLVFTFNDIKYGESLGSTSHHPNHSMAFKFEDEIETTKLTSIEFQVGRTGAITPVAVFEPVELDGTEVTRASVHNVSILKSLNLFRGDTISVYKANQIIPQVKENLSQIERERKGIVIKGLPYIRAFECPSCGQETELETTSIATREFCNNPKCPTKIIQQITHYCSKNAMDIVGLSEATITTFVNEGYINNIGDIYNLKNYKSEISNLKGFGVKSCNKILKAIEDSKNTTLDRFIYALGIDGVGRTTSKNLAKHFNNDFNEFMGATFVKFTEIEDIGDTTADNLDGYLYNNSYKIRLLFSYLTIKNEEKVVPKNTENILFGKIVYPTGTFALKKSELKVALEKCGAIISSGYKKSLDVLICGGDMNKSGKAKKAITDNEKGANITLMTEEELNEILKNI